MDVRRVVVTALVALLLLLAQPWVFSQISIMGLATPFVYLFVFLLLPIALSQTAMLWVGFTMGVLLDFFGGTPGLYTAALTFSAFSRKLIIFFFMDQTAPVDLPPSVATLGRGFYVFLFLLVSIHLLILMLLDAWSFFDPIFFLFRWGASVVFTYIALLLLYLFLPKSLRDKD